MVGFGNPAHHSGLVGTLFARHGVCSAVVGGTTLSHSSGCLVLQSLADLFRYAGLRSSASLALLLFFGVVFQARHRANPASAFRASGGNARFCRLSKTRRLKIWIKSTWRGYQKS